MPHRPRHADGRTAPPPLDSGADGGGTAAAELPAGAGAIARRAADRVPRHPRAARPDGRILRASRRLAVVRAQRGERAALPVSRLEIRRDRAMRRCAVGAGRVGLLPEDQAQGLSVRRDRRRDLGLHGSAGRTAAGAELRMGAPQAVAALHHQALAGEQLAAGDGRRHRFEPRVVPASRRSQFRSAAQEHRRREIRAQHQHRVRHSGVARRPPDRRTAQCRSGLSLLAHHAMADAVVHADPALQGAGRERPRLGADGRLQLHGVDHDVPSGARSVRPKKSS